MIEPMIYTIESNQVHFPQARGEGVGVGGDPEARIDEFAMQTAYTVGGPKGWP